MDAEDHIENYFTTNIWPIKFHTFYFRITQVEATTQMDKNMRTDMEADISAQKTTNTSISM